MANTDGVHHQIDLFHYRPTPWVCIAALILFGFSAALHMFQAVRYKMYWLLYTASACALVEFIGWIGRTQATFNFESASLGPYILQSALTLFAPTALLAANFILLGNIIARLGPNYSRLSPRLYSRIFLSCDIVTLWIQCGGSGLSASQNLSKIGGYISLTGIVLQLISIFCYLALGTEFLVRYAKNTPLKTAQSFRGKATPGIRNMIYGMGIMTAFIVIRSIYRTVELIDGWDGSVAATQWLFVVFDALMIVCALYTLHVFHPGRLLTDEQETEYEFAQAPKVSYT